jgi:hypothetical protein
MMFSKTFVLRIATKYQIQAVLNLSFQFNDGNFSPIHLSNNFTY